MTLSNLLFTLGCNERIVIQNGTGNQLYCGTVDRIPQEEEALPWTEEVNLIKKGRNGLRKQIIIQL